MFQAIWCWLACKSLTGAESIWPSRSEHPSARRCLHGTMSAGTKSDSWKGLRVLFPELTNNMCTFECVLTSSCALLALSSSLRDFFRASGPTTDRIFRNLSSQKIDNQFNQVLNWGDVQRHECTSLRNQHNQATENPRTAC